MDDEKQAITISSSYRNCWMSGDMFVKDFFDNEELHVQSGCPTTLKNIHLFLMSHLDYVVKKVYSFSFE